MNQANEIDTAPDMTDNSCAVIVIPSHKHPINNSMIDKDALYVLRKLQDAGFAGYLVGGGVRDLYLGKEPKDFDISTDAHPGQLRKLFPHSNTIGRRFRLVQVFFKGGKTVEVSTLRSLSEYDLDGPVAVLAPNNTFGTLHEDARRRDLTINSLFYEIKNCTIIDYVNGSQDLANSIIRIVGDPEKRLTRDPVRMMRAIRHAARNGFSIEEQSWKAICTNADKLRLCPPSRLRDELLKDLYSEASGAWFPLAYDSGLFLALFPFYRKTLTERSENAQQQRELLGKLFTSIDNLNSLSKTNNIHRQKDFFLIALLLTPFVESRYQLYTTPRKGGALFQYAKQIRQDIDQGIGIDLNLRKSLRQEVVNYLINLALLIHNNQHGNWPNWLKRKSYFKRARLFYHCYQAALTNTELDLESLSQGAPKDSIESVVTRTTIPGESTEEPHHKPVVVKNQKGGIFGLKR
jgi:poly(A) polymerase